MMNDDDTKRKVVFSLIATVVCLKVDYRVLKY